MSDVMAAILASGGSLRASFILDADGRTVSAVSADGKSLYARQEGNRAYRCSGCHADGHSIERCNGPGQPPKPNYQERRLAAKINRKADLTLATARAEIQRRIEERKK